MSSVALWYQTEPHKRWPALSAGPERLPFREQTLLVGPKAGSTAKHSDHRVQVQEVGGVTDGKQLWFTPSDDKGWVEVAFIGCSWMVKRSASSSLHPRGTLLKPHALAAYTRDDMSAIEFKRRHPELVWSNSQATEAVWIRAALLQPRFTTILDACLEIGLDRVRKEWELLRRENAEEAARAEPEVSRILKHIEEGFTDAQAGD